MSEQKKLGRGIASLLAMDDEIDYVDLDLDTNTSISTNKNTDNIVSVISVDDIITNPHQPRKKFDELKLKELSESIKNNGLLQPIIVNKTTDNNKYMIIAGERRFRATKMAGFSKIKAIIIKMEEKDILRNALIENIQRENLNPVEEANGYRRIIEDFGYTHEQLAKEVGKSRAHITNLLRILNLPNEILSALKNDNISLGHAKVLLSVNNPIDYLEDIIVENLSVRQLEKRIENKDNQASSNLTNDTNINAIETNPTNITFDIIKQMYDPIINVKQDNDNKKDNSSADELSYNKKKIINDNLKMIEKHLLEKCGIVAHLKLNKDGSGKIEIDYKDDDELLKILNKLN